MRKRIFVVLMLCCANVSFAQQTIKLLPGNPWKDVFSNQSGQPVVIEITKKQARKTRVLPGDSTRINVVPTTGATSTTVAAMEENHALMNSADFSSEGATKLLKIPPGFKLIAITSQKRASIYIRKGYFFQKQLANKKNK